MFKKSKKTDCIEIGCGNGCRTDLIERIGKKISTAVCAFVASSLLAFVLFGMNAESKQNDKISDLDKESVELRVRLINIEKKIDTMSGQQLTKIQLEEIIRTAMRD